MVYLFRLMTIKCADSITSLNEHSQELSTLPADSRLQTAGYIIVRLLILVMQLMVQEENSLNSFNNINTAQVKDDSTITIDKVNQTRSVRGEIMNVNNAEIISIKNYFGSEISKIRTGDIYRIKDGLLYIYCDSAMKVSNRIVLEIGDRSIEIDGEIIECFSSEAI